MPEAMETAPPPVRRRPARSTTSASCSHPGRSARSSSRSSGSPTCSRSATRAWPASPRRPGLVALPPDVTLAAAGRLGVREDLEVACWAAISEAGAPPAGRLLFVNVAPDALGHPGLLELAERLPARLVIELTEQDAVQNTVQLRERLRPWIARGALVAVDDAGAGFTSLEYVAELRPDFLKLCRGMVTGVDLDPSRQAVLRATVAFAREVGARVVAEGVERPEELAILRDAEVDYGQGWLFGRPAEAWPEEPSARAGRAAAPARRAAGARARRGHERPRGVRGGRRAPRPQGPDAERLPRGRRPPALPGRARLLADLRRHARHRGRDRPHLPHRRGDDRRGRRRQRGLPARRRLGARRGLRAAARRAAASPACSTPSRRPRPATPAVAEIERCARAARPRAWRRSAGSPSVSPAQQLARIAVRLGSLEDAEDIVRETVAAARALAGFESAMLALPDGHGGYYVHHAEGSFAVALGALERGRARRGSPPGSTRAPRATRPATAGGRGFEGHEVLRAGRRQRRDRAAARRRRRAPRAAAGRRPRQPPDRHGEGRAARAARRPGGGLAADGRRGHRAARARGARPADRPRPPRHLLRRGARRARARAPRRAAARRPARRRRRLQGDQRHRAATRPATTCCARSPACCGRSSPAHGRAFRIGGDEFAMLFECAGEAEAWRGRLGPAGAVAQRGSARRCRSGSRSPRPARATSSSWRAPTRRSTRSSAAAATACCWRLGLSRTTSA